MKKFGEFIKCLQEMGVQIFMFKIIIQLGISGVKLLSSWGENVANGKMTEPGSL